MLDMTVQDVFMNPIGTFFEVHVPFYGKKVSTSAIRTISLIRYYSTGALDNERLSENQNCLVRLHNVHKGKFCAYLQ